jgi:hypothetical protein
MEDSVLTETTSQPVILDNSPEFAEPAPPEAPPAELTRKQIGQLRRAHMTVVYGTVKACGHKAKFAKDKDPGNNCIHCWFAYFMTSVDLEFIHTVLTQKGAPALIAMKGKKFVRMFHGFLSSKMLPILQAEIEKSNEETPAKIMGGTFGNGTTGNEVQATSVAE